MEKIIRNAIQCKKCGDIIESRGVHDFVTCSCGACSVDGGHEYLRRCGHMEDIIELSITESEEKKGAEIMDKPELTEKQIQTLYHQVMTDDTYWDDMNAAELEKRLDDFNAHKRSRNKMISLLSCLRLAPCVYLRERVNDNWTIPIINIPNTPVLTIFSSTEQIKSENFKPFDVADARLPELLESIKMEGEPHIVVNPDTQAVILPLSLVKGIFDICDDVVSTADEQMANGLSSEQLDDEMFEHFFCRTVECETLGGQHITGDAYMYKKTKQTGGFLLVDIGGDDPAVIYKNDVKFIKDVTPWDEEDSVL